MFCNFVSQVRLYSCHYCAVDFLVDSIGDALVFGDCLFHFGVEFWFIHVVFDLGFKCLFESFVCRFTNVFFQYTLDEMVE